jgi:hypothetical protein
MFLVPVMDVFRTDDSLFIHLVTPKFAFHTYFYIDYLTTVTLSRITQYRKQGNGEKWIVRMQN